MNKEKLFLNIAIGVSIVICSIALLIFSCKDAPARAQTISSDGYTPVGCWESASGGKYHVVVIGYNAKTSDIKIIADKPLR